MMSKSVNHLETELWKFLPLYIENTKIGEVAESIENGNSENFGRIMEEVAGFADEKLCKKEISHVIEKLYLGKEALRELAQNSIDAYKRAYADNTKYSAGEIKISVRQKGDSNYDVSFEDFGTGMDLSAILNYLLVIGSSDKMERFSEIGKHGLGFYSTLKNSSAVTVETHDWMVRLFKNDDEYKVKFSRLGERRQGTKVTMHNFSVNKPAEKISEYCGYVNPESFKIFVNDRQINSRAGIEFAKELPVKLRDKDYAISLGIGVKQHSPKIFYTQEGLTVDSFDNENGLAEILVDIPPKLVLSRGRRNVPEDLRELLQKPFKRLYREYGSYILQKAKREDISPEEFMFLQKHFSSREEFARFFEAFKYLLKELRIARVTGRNILDTGLIMGGFVGGTYGLAKLAELLPPIPPEVVYIPLGFGAYLGGSAAKNRIQHYMRHRKETNYEESIELVGEKGRALEEILGYLKRLFSFKGFSILDPKRMRIIPATKKEFNYVQKLRISKREGMGYLREGSLFFDEVREKNGHYLNPKYEVVFADEISKIQSEELKRFLMLEKKEEKRERIKKEGRARRSSLKDIILPRLEKLPGYLADYAVRFRNTSRSLGEFLLNAFPVMVPNAFVDLAAMYSYGRDKKMFLEVASYVSDIIARANDLPHVKPIGGYRYSRITAAETHRIPKIGTSTVMLNWRSLPGYMLEEMKSGIFDEESTYVLSDLLCHEYGHFKTRVYDYHNMNYWKLNEIVKINFHHHILKNNTDLQRNINSIINKYHPNLYRQN